VRGRGRAAGPALAVGPKGRRATRLKRTDFHFIFNSATAQNPILNPKNSFLESDPKTKVILNFAIFNFAKRSKVKILIDFEVRI
jgi:hypothetical protein